MLNILTYFNSERVIVRGVLLTNTFSKMSQGFFKTIPLILKIYISMNKTSMYSVLMCCTDSISFIDIKIVMFIMSLTYIIESFQFLFALCMIYKNVELIVST
jgi:hypothetical protein